ncbi:MAG: restriction endonuclease subunit S [Prevotella sp.]|nr:restriction endonuclease subunit S [Prevotella sp.]
MKEGWEYKKIDDISTIVGRIGFRGYTKNDLVSKPELGAITLSPSNIINGELSFEKCSYISLKKYEESPEIMLAEGDVVLVKTASIGKCSIVRSLPHKATLNPQFVVFKNIKIDNEYFNYYIKSPYFQKSLKTIVGGVAIPTLSQKKLGQLEIYFPTSYDEQRRIVSYLDSSFKLIDEIKNKALKSLTEAKALFQSALAEAMEPKEGWEEKTLKEVAKYRRGSFPQPYGKKEWYDGKGSMPFVQVADLQEDNFDLNDITKKRISKKAQEFSVFVEKGTVLVSLQGSIGKVAITQYDSYVDRTVAIFFKIDDFLNKYFFAIQLKLRFEIERVKARGTTIKTITKEEFSNFSINIPPLPTQKQIVSHLDSLSSKVRAIEEKYQKMVEECDALKQAMLRDVFE